MSLAEQKGLIRRLACTAGSKPGPKSVRYAVNQKRISDFARKTISPDNSLRLVLWREPGMPGFFRGTDGYLYKVVRADEEY